MLWVMYAAYSQCLYPWVSEWVSERERERERKYIKKERDVAKRHIFMRNKSNGCGIFNPNTT